MNVLNGKMKQALLCCLLAANGVLALVQAQDAMVATSERAEASANAGGLSSYWQRVAEHLQGRDDLRDRALAVLLGAAGSEEAATVSGRDRPSARMLVLVGQSRDSLALNLAVQAGLALDDPALVKAAALQWSQLEPDNLAPRLFLAASGDALLAQSDSIHRFELHGYAPIRLMQQRFAEVPMTAAELPPIAAYAGGLVEEGRILVSAFGLWAAYSYPSLASLTRACRDDSLQAAPQRRAQCLRLGRVLSQSSDTMLGQYLGVALLGHAADSPQERNAVTALRRAQTWQQYNRYSGFSAADTAEEVAQMLRLLRMPEIDNEVQMLEFRLREQGVALTPPEDWQPPQRMP